MMGDKGSHSPQCCQSQADHEGYADATPRNGAGAPALEHGNHSNDEEYDSRYGQEFKPHVFSPLLMLPGGPS